MSRYYDIDDILTDGQPIPVVFQVDVPGLGYLDRGRSAGKDLKEGTRMELPLWLAEILAVSGVDDQSGFVTVTAPNALSTKAINALRAEAVSVDLRTQSLHFYNLAERWLAMAGEEDEDKMLETVMSAIKARAVVVNDYAHNTRTVQVTNSDFINRLDDTEQKLFRAAHDSAKDVKKWLIQK
ncbi:DNA replication complex GINS protein-like protein psf3 [Lipomyces arxii]|uniref:DNA replication complex GINS protein-like protein psf3 n=1 Tax=Lipomyces arxii TaxID=56418 RepID=UPI0034CF5F76